jgi:hypothetical protein
MPFPFIPLALSGLSALSGGLGSREQEPNQTSTSQISDPRFMNFRNRMLGQAENLFSSVPTEDQFRTSGISDINRTAGLRNQSLESILAARGIRGPAAGTALAGAENQRFGDIVRLNQQIPFLRQQMMESALRTSGAVGAALPFNQTTTGSQTSPGNVAGSTLGSLASTLALAFFAGKR